jgi:hypothetical protein
MAHETRAAEATIKIGNKNIRTPDIININVNRSRGVGAKASASFRYRGDFDNTAGPIVIYFYSGVIFSGVITRFKINASLRCANEQTISLQAEDNMIKLRNSRYTRRQRLDGLGPIVFISSLHKRTHLGFDSPTTFHDLESDNSPAEIVTHTVNMVEQTQWANVGGDNTLGGNHWETINADEVSGAAASAGGGGFILHDHTS